MVGSALGHHGNAHPEASRMVDSYLTGVHGLQPVPVSSLPV